MVFSSFLGDRTRTPKIKRSKAPKASSASSAATASSTTTTTATGRTPEPTITSKNDNPPEDAIPPEYIHHESHLGDPPDDGPDLRELNNSLEALAVVFPNVQVEVFREMLSSFDGESRLALVADALLKNSVSWVKGRWRVVAADRGGDGNDNDDDDDHRREAGSKAVVVPPAETFRAEEYKAAVRGLAWHEFKGLSRSTINAVLAESNYSYLEARRVLATLSEKSWRFAISSLFLRRKPVAPSPTGDPAQDHHPLVVWRSTGKGSIVPTVRRTGHDGLDRELFDALVRPLRDRARREQEARDKELAQYLNNEEAAELDATYECCCCFTDGAFEEFAACGAEGHLLCFRCVQHSLSEAVFGQGWRSVDEATGTLRCMAVEGGDECPGRVAPECLRRAMLDTAGGADILRRFDQRLTEQSLLAAGVPLVRCPFCDYAEVDDLYLPPDVSSLRVRVASIFNVLFIMLCVGTIPFLLPTLILSTVACLLLCTRTYPGPYLASEWRSALHRRHRRRRGQRFSCLRPSCSRASCLACGKAWADVHICNESSLVSLRTRIEQAMSAAVKRVCPRCATSFVKSSGCNKLRCPCGYAMCYVCRADIRGDGYRHFCDHFRPEGDATACAECSRCNLWETEDTEALLRDAREEAERSWVEDERRELSGAERAFLETGVAAVGGGGGVHGAGGGGGGAGQGGSGGTRGPGFWAFRAKGGAARMPTVPEVLDLVIETLFV